MKMSSVSIEPQMVSVVLLLPSVEQTKQNLQEKHQGCTIIAVCGIGQHLQGVALKFLAFEQLLNLYLVWKSHAVMV